MGELTEDTQNADIDHGLKFDGRITYIEPTKYYIEPNIILNHCMNICSSLRIVRSISTKSFDAFSFLPRLQIVKTSNGTPSQGRAIRFLEQ